MRQKKGKKGKKGNKERDACDHNKIKNPKVLVLD